MAVADTIKPLTTIVFDTDDGVNFPGPDCVMGLVLAANTAESMTIPGSGATKSKYVRIATDANLYIDSTKPAVVATDLATGLASELLPSAVGERWYYLGNATALSFITDNAGGGHVTASFYRD